MSKEIFAAMVKAQKDYGAVLKTKVNPGFKGSKYADLAATIEAVSDSLNANGIAVAQVCHESSDGVVVETKFLHDSGEEWSGGKLFIPSSAKTAQGFGSALTYARRYSLLAACGIAPEDDDGNAASELPPPPRQQSPQPKPAPKAEPINLELFTGFLVKAGSVADIDAVVNTADFRARLAVSETDRVNAAIEKRKAALVEREAANG